MATPTIGAFRVLFPEFVDRADEDVTAAITRAGQLHTITQEGWLHCAAHLLARQPEQTGEVDGGSGVVRSETLGPQTVAYDTQSGGDDRKAFFATTAYGRLVLAIESRNPKMVIGAVVV